MLKTTNGSPDGIIVENYKEGQEYDLSGALLGAFLQMGVCEQVAIDSPPEKAVLNTVPEVKAKPATKGKGK